MKLALLAILLLLVCGTAFAGDATLSWTAPTQNEDGSALTDLASYKIYHGTTPAGPYPNEVVVANPALTSFIVTGLPQGLNYFVATAINSQGIESGYSGEASKDVPAPAPNPPFNLVVEPDNLVAYTFDKIRGGLSVYPIGSVPEGTPCDSSVSVNGMNQVAADAVIYPVGVSLDPFVVVAACGAG